MKEAGSIERLWRSLSTAAGVRRRLSGGGVDQAVLVPPGYGAEESGGVRDLRGRRGKTESSGGREERLREKRAFD